MKYELPSTELIVIEENNYLKFGEYLNDMQCDDTTNKLCLDDLEYVKKLQQENKQLKGNWNKLKEFIKECLEAIDTLQELTGNAIEDYTPRILTYNQIKNKMQELQGSDSNGENKNK